MDKLRDELRILKKDKNFIYTNFYDKWKQVLKEHVRSEIDQQLFKLTSHKETSAVDLTLPGHHYLGPGSKLEENKEPSNERDQIAYLHDWEYFLSLHKEDVSEADYEAVNNFDRGDQQQQRTAPDGEQERRETISPTSTTAESERSEEDTASFRGFASTTPTPLPDFQGFNSQNEDGSLLSDGYQRLLEIINELNASNGHEAPPVLRPQRLHVRTSRAADQSLPNISLHIDDQHHIQDDHTGDITDSQDIQEEQENSRLDQLSGPEIPVPYIHDLLNSFVDEGEVCFHRCTRKIHVMCAI
ncbi:uncharacterized protein LOC111867456 [Cryptotermes secundus]|uniref:uncharacterized protein LOC111867456 n=1 Tax=Cryptotermes secundus TaxID=105785 RepID=UPI001454BCB3|nr:uncharacterized protein LOC111867456 [Cryptotermes secundus]